MLLLARPCTKQCIWQYILFLPTGGSLSSDIGSSFTVLLMWLHSLCCVKLFVWKWLTTSRCRCSKFDFVLGTLNTYHASLPFPPIYLTLPTFMISDQQEVDCLLCKGHAAQQGVRVWVSGQSCAWESFFHPLPLSFSLSISPPRSLVITQIPCCSPTSRSCLLLLYSDSNHNQLHS